MLQMVSSKECTVEVAPWTEGLLREHAELHEAMERSRETGTVDTVPYSTIRPDRPYKVDPVFQFNPFTTPLRVAALGHHSSPVSLIDRVTEDLAAASRVQAAPRQSSRPTEKVHAASTDDDLLWEQHDTLEQPPAPVFSWDGPLQPGDTPILSTLSARAHENEYQAFMASPAPFKEDIIAEVFPFEEG